MHAVLTTYAIPVSMLSLQGCVVLCFFMSMALATARSIHIAFIHIAYCHFYGSGMVPSCRKCQK